MIIHLSDLPHDLVYVKLEAAFRSKFFRKLRDKYGSQGEIAELIGTQSENICRWSRGRRICQLKNLLKLASLIDEPVEQLEKHILAIQSGNNEGVGKGNGAVLCPKFPLKLTPALSEIAGHILHDGGLHKNSIRYTSKSRSQLDYFLSLLYTEVGMLKPVYFVSSLGGISIQTPKIVLTILHRAFNFQFGAKVFVDPRIPEPIRTSGDPKVIAAFLRAAFTDEGCVSKKYILLKLSKTAGNNQPPRLLIDNHDLLQKLSIKPGKMRISQLYTTKKGAPRESWGLYITGKENLIKFQKLIGFSCKEKSDKLMAAINSYKR